MSICNILLVILHFFNVVSFEIADILHEKDSSSSCSLKIGLLFYNNESNIENESGNNLRIWISFSNSRNMKFTSGGLGLESSRRWKCEITSRGADSTTGYSIATLHGLNKNQVKNNKKADILCKITSTDLKTQKKRTNDDKALMSQAVCGALQYSVTTITISYNINNSDYHKSNNNNKNNEDSSSIEYDRENRFFVSRDYVLSTPLRFYYLLTPSGSPQYMTRYENVMNFLNSNSNSNNGIINIDKIGIFDALFWKNWDQIRFLFSYLKLPNKHMIENRGMLNRKGKYGRWASLIMAAAYAVQFNLPYLILLEDDSKWPMIDDFSASLRRILPSPESPCIVKLSKWGEGYVFPLQGAKIYLQTVYEIGINKHSDTWIRDNMNVIYFREIEHKLLIWSNQGNILRTPYAVNHVDFAYNASWGDSSPLFNMISHGKSIKKIRGKKENLLFPSSKATNFSSIIVGLKKVADETPRKVMNMKRNRGKIQNQRNEKYDKKLQHEKTKEKRKESDTNIDGSSGNYKSKDWLLSIVRSVVSSLASIIPARITESI